MAQFHGSHLCTLGERSEGATIQLTTCGACPKPCESQHWCVPPQSCMHGPRGPHCAAASERPPVTTHHLWGAMFSLSHCVYMCNNVFMFLYCMCMLYETICETCSLVYLGMCASMIWKKIQCVCLVFECVFVCMRVWIRVP